MTRLFHRTLERNPPERRMNGPTLSRQLMTVAFKAICMALLLSSVALMTYELRNDRSALRDELGSQAQVIAAATTPALAFKDSKAASDTLHMLRFHPKIAASALYLEDGRPFAAYLRSDVMQAVLPASLTQKEPLVMQGMVEFYQPIFHQGVQLGTLYLRAHDDTLGRHGKHLLILLAITAASASIALLLAFRLQRDVTAPILRLTQLAREAMTRRDFSLRAADTSPGEVGELVDAFNHMLTEVEARSSTLDAFRRNLSVEMAERTKAQTTIRELACRKDEFLAMLAHELRSPLAPISDSVAILRHLGEQQDAPLRDRTLDIMNRQLGHMVRLIDDLLDISRITTGRLVLHKERSDLVQILHDALETSEPLLASRHHVMDVRLPDQSVYSHADPVRLCQAFANLLDNAARYTAEGGLISLHMQVHDGVAEISVQDNGIGIPLGMRQAVFDMFVQVDSSTEGGQAGLGIGLILTRELIWLHGGDIRLREEEGRGGSEFVVHLPLSV